MPLKYKSLLILVALIASLLAGCQMWRIPSPKLPEPLRQTRPEVTAPNKAALAENADVAELQSQAEQKRFTETPGTVLPPTVAGLDTFEEKLPGLKGGAFKLDVDNMPLPAFINEVYGNMLHVSFQIDKTLQNVPDLITLRITQPQSAEELSRVVAKILAEYGVAIKKEQDRYRFLRSSTTPIEEPPLLISGRTLPQVPVTHRPIFQVVPLYHVRNINVTSALNQIYTGQELKITEDPERNTVTLQGSQQLVASALDTIKFLDQPAMRGHYSLRIDPLYQTPEALSEALVQVLQSEGYGASATLPMGSILVLPMSKINAVLVFTADPKVLALVKQWVQVLDQPTYGTDKDTIFYYPVKNTGAEDLAKTLSNLVPNIATQQAANAQKRPGTTQQAISTTSTTSGGGKTNLVVDKQRNALLFFGDSDTWAQLLPIIQQMDLPSKQVLIEVTIAEITLGDTDKFGIQWLINGKVGEYNFDTGTLVGAGAGAIPGAFNYILNSGGTTRMVLNALATNSRVNVLSTPRLMVKSGEEANIEIGTEVPIVTSQGVPSGSAQTNGSSIFTQNVQYRKTGVILNIKPVIHSGRRIDIDISQELSSAQNNETSSISSPSILNRKVETSLSLKDGTSVLLAGLISDTTKRDDSGIPYLKDIPWLGNIFSTKGGSHDKSEIVIMIIPYILEQDRDVELISEAFRSQYSFGQHEKYISNPNLMGSGLKKLP
ncbi:MAG: secretin N-terminal domain-containing protein [Methylovulum sp.]|nr:secretin N-terminal domain-containing protein [Methylovulum sp.]